MNRLQFGICRLVNHIVEWPGDSAGKLEEITSRGIPVVRWRSAVFGHHCRAYARQILWCQISHSSAVLAPCPASDAASERDHRSAVSVTDGAISREIAAGSFGWVTDERLHRFTGFGQAWRSRSKHHGSCRDMRQGSDSEYCHVWRRVQTPDFHQHLRHSSRVRSSSGVHLPCHRYWPVTDNLATCLFWRWLTTPAWRHWSHRRSCSICSTKLHDFSAACRPSHPYWPRIPRFFRVCRKSSSPAMSTGQIHLRIISLASRLGTLEMNKVGSPSGVALDYIRTCWCTFTLLYLWYFSFIPQPPNWSAYIHHHHIIISLIAMWSSFLSKPCNAYRGAASKGQ